MVNYFFAIVTGFVVSYMVIPVVIKYSLKRNLVDVPGRRKIHKKIMPSMGGIAIFIGFILSTVIWVDVPLWKDIRYILASLFIVFFIGTRDDLLPLPVYFKLLGQFFAASLIVVLIDIRITSLYGLLEGVHFPFMISYVFTVFTFIIVTNSFNLIDGIDGLAATVASISLLGFGIWFALTGHSVYAFLSFALLGSIVAFLIFNWDPAQVFMGDTGALVIGMMLSLLSIHFINVNHGLPDTNPFKFQGSIATAMCFIVIPLVDTARIILVRVLKRQYIFKPDKNHIHHGLVRLGLTHGHSAMILGGFHIAFIVLAVFFRNYEDIFLLPALVILAFAACFVLDRLILRKLSRR